MGDPIWKTLRAKKDWGHYSSGVLSERPWVQIPILKRKKKNKKNNFDSKKTQSYMAIWLHTMTHNWKIQLKLSKCNYFSSRLLWSEYDFSFWNSCLWLMAIVTQEGGGNLIGLWCWEVRPLVGD
jgi:hypothetical protein